MSSRPQRTQLGVALGLCLLGAALVLLALSRAWLAYRVGTPPLPSRRSTVTGAELSGGARALALVGLAGVAAVPATRGLARTLVGVLIAVAGAGIVADVVRVLADPADRIPRLVPKDVRSDSLGGWPYVALLGALLLVAAGLLIVVRGRSWASMSSRYDAPAQRPREGEASLWEALDRGEDPTKEGTGTGG
jgi:uncharacterized membrane protein (TIGR02234 family)